MFDRGWFPVSRPREAKGGIKAKSKTGAFASSWWGKRWISVLESFHLGTRLTRGRAYARRGQVLDINIAKGSVKARVQGSRPRPYEIALAMKPLPEADWAGVVRAISSQALFASKLLAGEMPPEIEDVFRSEKMALFPAQLSDIGMECSCPDWSRPCKHIAAVFYLLGEEFDRDPFLLFRLRGMEREELTAAMSGIAAGAAAEDEPVEPKPIDATDFWSRPLPPGRLDEPAEPAVAAALLHRLGRLPFWSGDQELIAALEPVYRRAALRWGGTDGSKD